MALTNLLPEADGVPLRPEHDQVGVVEAGERAGRASVVLEAISRGSETLSKWLRLPRTTS